MQKETVKITPSESSVLQSLNKKILSFQREHQESIDTNIDSLRKHNKELNKELRTLITSMDEQTKCILQEKEHNLLKIVRSIYSYYNMARFICSFYACYILLDYSKGLTRKNKDENTIGGNNQTEYGTP